MACRQSEGSLKPPIFLTSTFVFNTAAEGKRVFEGITGKRPGGAEGLVYGRFNGPDQEILEDRLALWERAEDAAAFSTGMSAITRALIERTRAQRRITVIYVESPANPTNKLVDIAGIAALRDAIYADAPDDRPLIMVDNTFLGPVFRQPIRNGADVSLYSLTKYIGGHSDLVAGGAVGSKAALYETATGPMLGTMVLRSTLTVCKFEILFSGSAGRIHPCLLANGSRVMHTGIVRAAELPRVAGRIAHRPSTAPAERPLRSRLTVAPVIMECVDA